MVFTQRSFVCHVGLLRTFFAWASLSAFLLACGPEAEAGSRRARLSEDLARRVAAGETAATTVIVTGTQARVERIAARHGLSIRKRLAKAKNRRAAAARALRRLDALRRETAKVNGTIELRRALSLYRRGLVHYRSGQGRSGRKLLARAAVGLRAVG